MTAMTMRSPSSARTTRSPAPPRGRPLVPLQQPELPDPAAIMRHYARSQDACFYSNGGPCARLLTSRLEHRLGNAAFCVPTGNCTVGLMAAARAVFGAPERSRRIVLTPAYTFTATACALAWTGYEPEFVDIEPRGWHLDATALEAALAARGPSVAGVMACAAFGTAPPAAQRAAWRAACESHGVPLMIDSAAGFGASGDDGRMLGAVGDTEVFSFHATKPFAIGEGGLVVTHDPEVAARTARLINFGLEPDTRVSAEAGLNGKMSELHAATGLAMLEMFDDALARRRRTAARLREAVGELPLMHQAHAERSTWQVFPVLAPTPAARDRVVDLAPAHGIQVRTMHDPPLHRHPAFAGKRNHGLAITDLVAERALALPMANDLGEDAVERIAALAAAALT